MNPVANSATLAPLAARSGQLEGTQRRRTSSAVDSARPVAGPERTAKVSMRPQDPAAETARREVAAALRAAARRALASTEDGPARDLPLSSRATEALRAQVTRKAALPVLPEPASPSRTAFAEAVIAMRAGVNRNGDAPLASLRA